jgi:hypothetical protein
MGNRTRRLSVVCVLAVASQLVGLAPARAEILNLVCRRGGEPDGLVYWVDLARGTITFANFNFSSQSVHSSTVQTVPVAISREAFHFTSSLGPVTINRITGVNVWPRQSAFSCSKGTLPLPSTRF